MPYVYGYVRVSDELQLGHKAVLNGAVVDNTAISTHKHLIAQAWANTYQALYPAHEFNGFFEDPAQSSQVPLARRPQGAMLLSYLQPHDIVIVADLDRMFGRAGDFDVTMDLFNKKQVRLISLAQGNVDFSDTDGELMGSLRVIIKRQECRRLAQRLKTAYHVRESKGLVTGRFVPLGYQKQISLDPDTHKRLVGFIPCQREQWLMRIFRWMRALDPKEWGREAFLKWSKEHNICRGPKGKARRFYWVEFRVADKVVNDSFPPVQLVSSRLGYRRDRVSSVEVHVRRRLAPSDRPKPKRVSLDHWAARLWSSPPLTSAWQLQHPQYPVRGECPAVEASPEPDISPVPANSAPEV